MPIGSVPPNTTKATALEFALDPNTLTWGNTQATSWYPGNVFVPPGPATAFELWYKFKPKSLIEANYYSTIGCIVWNMGDGVNYHPNETEGSHVTVSDFDELRPIYGMCVQYYTNVIKDGYYYFKVVTPPPTTVPITKVGIRVSYFKHAASIPGAISVQDSHANGAIVVLNKINEADNLNAYTVAKHIYPGETGHSVSGQAGDILLINGITCIQDDAIAGVSIRNKDYGDRVSFTVGRPVQIRRDSHEARFWMSLVDPADFSGSIRSITIGAGGTGTAALTPKINPTGVGAANRARVIGVFNNTILYYTLYEGSISNDIGEGTIRRWNVQSNTAMPDFYTQSTTPSTYLGRPTDILPLVNGDVLVGFLAEETMGNFASNYIYRVRKFNSAGTIIASIIDHVPGPAHGRITYGETNEFFYVWRHSNIYETLPNVSIFSKYNVSDLVEGPRIRAHEFRQQALLYEHSLYSGFMGDNPQDPATSYGSDRGYIISPYDGASTYANFWINPFPIAIPTIPPVTPPIDPTPVDPNIGGGLIMIDPSNTTRHDVYLDHLGNPLNFPIQILIRTAYLGD